MNVQYLGEGGAGVLIKKMEHYQFLDAANSCCLVDLSRYQILILYMIIPLVMTEVDTATLKPCFPLSCKIAVSIGVSFTFMLPDLACLINNPRYE